MSGKIDSLCTHTSYYMSNKGERILKKKKRLLDTILVRAHNSSIAGYIQ